MADKTPQPPTTEGETCTWRGALKTVAGDAAGGAVITAAAIAPAAGMAAVVTGGALAPAALDAEILAASLGGLVGAEAGVDHVLQDRALGKCAPSSSPPKPTGP